MAYTVAAGPPVALYNGRTGSRLPHLPLDLLSRGFHVSSLYRKWRSRSFLDLFGQDHVVRTLRNAVSQGRVAHAYLFTGPRGTGKTSTARILAKAVNCLTPEDGNPCNNCEMCRAADEGRAIDVIEIDAASNTSVDNVRDLRERVAYAAGEARFKVYIVDEVHRLSGAAFDAFLKTLEEPPEHVIFVFASTEPHKVPATIMSRCQRLDFRRIVPSAAYERLHYVATQEGLSVSEDALRLMVQAANGSLRDALGVLDQVASYTDGEITDSAVRGALGLTDPTLVARLTDHLLNTQVGSGLSEIARFLEAGGDPGQVTRQLIEYWRALLLRATGVLDGPALDPVLQQSLIEHAARVDGRQIIMVLRALAGQDFSAKFNLPAELPLEIGYVQASLALREGSPPSSSQTRELSLEAQSAPPATPPEQRSTLRTPTQPTVSAPATPPPAQLSEPVHTDLADIDTAWAGIVQNMRVHSRSLEALLKSGYLMGVSEGEMTVGFLHDFHRDQFTDVKKRRLLEEVVGKTLGATYRVTCIKVTREEVEAARGDVMVDDGFIEEVADRLRAYHIGQLGTGHS